MSSCGGTGVFLTDLRQSEIEKMRQDVASGALHPMEAKKRLARTNRGRVSFGGGRPQSDEDWAMQFQQRNVEGVAEEAVVDLRRVVRADAAFPGPAVRDGALAVDIDVAKAAGRTRPQGFSRTDADRQVTAGVGIDGVTSNEQGHQGRGAACQDLRSGWEAG